MYKKRFRAQNTKKNKQRFLCKLDEFHLFIFACKFELLKAQKKPFLIKEYLIYTHFTWHAWVCCTGQLTSTEEPVCKFIPEVSRNHVLLRMRISFSCILSRIWLLFFEIWHLYIFSDLHLNILQWQNILWNSYCFYNNIAQIIG